MVRSNSSVLIELWDNQIQIVCHNCSDFQHIKYSDSLRLISWVLLEIELIWKIGTWADTVIEHFIWSVNLVTCQIL